jgi:hypothetical protein
MELVNRDMTRDATSIVTLLATGVVPAPRGKKCRCDACWSPSYV